MKQLKIGLAGIGKLGSAMMKHWNDYQIPIGIYHPDYSKCEQFLQSYPNGYKITRSELNELHILILALPADAIVPFMAQCVSKHPYPNTIFINMATSLSTLDILNKFPDLNILGLKFMGHSRDLMEHGDGLFIAQKNLPEEVIKLFQKLGEVRKDSEEVVIKVNKLATQLAVKAAVDLEEAFGAANLPKEYKSRALSSIVPEVIRSYNKGTHGQFASEIIKKMNNK